MENVNEFLKTSKARLQKVLNKLQWTENKTIENCDKDSLELEHKDREPSLPPSLESKNSVIIGEDELRLLLNDPTAKAPTKFSDLQLNFTREQKLLLYEHAVKNSTKISSSADGNLDIASIADIVAIKKREKKKKRKHRVSKPSFNEELRSLVEIQMQALEEYLKSKHKTDSTEEIGIKAFKEDDTERRRHRKCEQNKSRQNSAERKYENSRGYYHRDDLNERKYCRDRSREIEVSERNQQWSRERRRSRSRERNRYYDRHKDESKYKSRRSLSKSRHSRKHEKQDRSRSNSRYDRKHEKGHRSPSNSRHSRKHEKRRRSGSRSREYTKKSKYKQ